MRALPWLLGLSLSACAWPSGLPAPASPGLMRGGHAYPALVASRGEARLGRRDAAVIIAIDDYARLPSRRGAAAAAAAWYRYLRDTRRLRPWRISLLRGAEATPDAVVRALERARVQVRREGTVWFVFIGHVSATEPGRYGALWLAQGDGTAATLATHALAGEEVLRQIGYGQHPRAVAVLDGCLTDAGPRALPSGSETPELPGFAVRDARDDIPEHPFFWSVEAPILAEEVRDIGLRAEISVARARREPVDVAVFSAGTGPGCVAALPGTRVPALSYLLLGGLRGWADRDHDGSVTARELITQVTEMLRAGNHGRTAPSPAPRSFSADLTLARGVAESGPDLRGLLPPDIARSFPVATLLHEPVLWTRDPGVRFDRGRFRMGCASRRDGVCERDERPAHRVMLSRYQLDPFEVSNADYAACVAAGRCDPPDAARCFVWTGERFDRGAPRPELLTRPDHPVVCLTWYQAQRYCHAHARRLPTEAEWERAAAGTTQRRYPWGDAAPDCTRAQMDGCGEHTRPVGGHPAGATPEGVHDLAGNAAEWVHDWYARDIYAHSTDRDPSGAARGDVRVIRGGSYYDAPTLLRASYRYGLNPMSSFSTVGFRCAR